MTGWLAGWLTLAGWLGYQCFTSIHMDGITIEEAVYSMLRISNWQLHIIANERRVLKWKEMWRQKKKLYRTQKITLEYCLYCMESLMSVVHSFVGLSPSMSVCPYLSVYAVLNIVVFGNVVWWSVKIDTKMSCSFITSLAHKRQICILHHHQQQSPPLAVGNTATNTKIPP